MSRARPGSEAGSVRYLVIILGLVTAVVLLLLSVLAYLVTRRGPRRHTDKCSVLDSQGEAAPGLLSQPLVTCAGESLQFTTSLHSPDPANLRGPEVSCGGSEAGSSVPPAVIRSLRNIRREVVVDLEGRNVLR